MNRLYFLLFSAVVLQSCQNVKNLDSNIDPFGYSNNYHVLRYKSGRVARTVVFDNRGKLETIIVNPDMEKADEATYRKKQYIISFSDGKFISINNFDLNMSRIFSHNCLVDEHKQRPCNELDIFINPLNEDNIHPALRMPLEDNEDSDVLKQNGIDIDNILSN